MTISTNQATPGNSDDAPIRSGLSSKTLQLKSILEGKAPLLAQALEGAWVTLENQDNPDSLPQAAHSMRELMEKAPAEIPEVPVTQGSGSLTDDVRALHEAWKIIKKVDWASAPPWNGSINTSLAEWLDKAGVFFDTFAVSHQTRPEQAAAMVSALDGGGRSMPQNLIRVRVKEWGTLRQYFLKVAHHNSEADMESMKQNIGRMETFLLNLLYPQPIPEMEEIDDLITRGEAS